MAKVLLYVEKQDEGVKKSAIEILSNLKEHEVDAVVIGSLGEPGCEQLKEYGVCEVIKLTADSVDNYSSDAYAKLVSDLVRDNGYKFAFAAATSQGKDFFPRAAAVLEAGVASDLISFTFSGDDFVGVRPLFAGKCTADVKFEGSSPCFVTVRPNSLTVLDKKSGQGNIVELTGDAGEIRAKIKEIVKGASDRIDLTEANIIVSGGRAMENESNFSILFDLADQLGGAVGASRAAVDSGYAPHSMQVGQTGKTVAPNLYIACGISGAIQHMAGMRTSKTIVAVNTDPDAPIFSIADYGIVGDLFKVVPLLIEEFSKVIKK